MVCHLTGLCWGNRGFKTKDTECLHLQRTFQGKTPNKQLIQLISELVAIIQWMQFQLNIQEYHCFVVFLVSKYTVILPHTTYSISKIYFSKHSTLVDIFSNAILVFVEGHRTKSQRCYNYPRLGCMVRNPTL